jgi:hypothetical protein
MILNSELPKHCVRAEQVRLQDADQEQAEEDQQRRRHLHTGVLSVSPVCCAVTPCSDTCVLSVQVESEAHWRQLLEEEYAVVLTERRVYEGATATSRLGDDCASARL